MSEGQWQVLRKEIKRRVPGGAGFDKNTSPWVDIFTQAACGRMAAHEAQTPELKIQVDGGVITFDRSVPGTVRVSTYTPPYFG